MVTITRQLEASQAARSGLGKKEEGVMSEKTRREREREWKGSRRLGVILAAGPTQEQTPDQRAKLTADHRVEGGGAVGC